MLNKLQALIKKYNMISPGDTVICAVSGGADSMALLTALTLLKDKLKCSVAAAHFNHCLRGEVSDADEAFVREYCSGLQIPFYVGRANVVPGEKGLEAAARDARYGFFRTLSGKIATAHTAGDNAETVLMHMVRGTGLKGLGAISPVNGNLIRPMLTVTRAEVIAFLQEYHIPFVNDSTNDTDMFFRNRLRHHIMPVLCEENPKFSENLSAMAMRLREDEQLLQEIAARQRTCNVTVLRKMHPAIRSRVLAAFLEECGVKEPNGEHIKLAESLVFSEKPSASAMLPNGVAVRRNYNQLEKFMVAEQPRQQVLSCPGQVTFGTVTVIADFVDENQADGDGLIVKPKGKMIVRSRQSGDVIRLSGGTKSLKKLFIDRKIPEAERMQIPVIADDEGILCIYGIGKNLVETEYNGPCVNIKFIKNTTPFL